MELAQHEPQSRRRRDPGAAQPTATPEAIRAVYETGLQFDGDVDIPIIDWRHYLEDELDMHHSHQSFATRQRMLERRRRRRQPGDLVHRRPAGVAFDQTAMAFEVIDEWMANIRANPDAGVAANAPPRAVDSCFATDGTLIAAGADVWDGILDDGPAGACTERFPIYSTSRRQAGGPIEGGIWKCRTAVGAPGDPGRGVRRLAADDATSVGASRRSSPTGSATTPVATRGRLAESR